MTEFKMWSFNWSIFFTFFILFIQKINGQFDWQKYDNFDKIREKLDKVNADNCKIVDVNDLFLDADTVSHIPDIKWLGIDPVFPNRTNLLHVHNMAINRAFFYSYILQKVGDEAEPGKYSKYSLNLKNIFDQFLNFRFHVLFFIQYC